MFIICSIFEQSIRFVYGMNWDKTMMTLHWTRVSELSRVVARYMQIQPLGCLSFVSPKELLMLLLCLT